MNWELPVPIPDYQTIMLPLLRLAADGQEHRVRDAIEELAAAFHLTTQERSVLLPSGTDLTFDNRVGWARTYLKKAALLEAPRRGHFRITERGREVLGQKPPQINVQFLKRFAEFNVFYEHRPTATAQEQAQALRSDEDAGTPEDQLADAHLRLRARLSDELLQQLKNVSPSFFERIVVELLVRMGYGGSRGDAGRAIGKSGDGGIDGVINEDRLGLDAIYIQAKRWDNVVGRPEIQRFAGALQGQRANKGVFITTSDFTEEARRYADQVNIKIVLIDGERLAALMIDHSVGVSLVGAYEVKRIDSDYFDEA